MDEYFWLTICFFIFLLLAGKHIYKALFSFLQAQQDLIKDEITKATNILSEASGNLKEAEALYNELESSLKLIKENASKALEYDLSTRKANFKKHVAIKEKQFETILVNLENNFKKDMIELLIDNLHSKFILYFKKNKEALDKFTELAIKTSAK